MDADRIIGVIVDWAKAQPAIEAVAVVGSYARGTARADSDIDLVLLTTRPREFRTDTAWLDAIHWSAVGARPMRWEGENYGGLWSLRLWLEQDGGEIEFGFASPSWANVNPLDPGTRRVIADGCSILYDPDKVLSRLCAAVNGAAQ